MLALVSKNVPLDVAFSLEEAELIGWNVALGEVESGKTFNWDTMSWPED
jgi:hypothetical protein